MSGMSGQKYVFGSREWWAAFVESLNSDKDYSTAAKNWEDPITLVTKDFPPPVRDFMKRDQQAVWMDLYHGQCRAWEMLDDPSKKPAPITLTGTYEKMKKIALGELSPTVALMSGQLKVKGSMFKLVTNAGASAAFVNTIKKVPTEFLA